MGSALTFARRVAPLAAALVLAACGAAAPPPAPPKITAKVVAPKSPPPPSLPPGHLARGDVDGVLARGPAWVLHSVLVQEVIRDNKFIGWRVLKLPDAWSGGDLKPGDVVTHVNGTSLQNQDDFFSAWSSLAIASDLRVAYERDGASRELIYHIDGESPGPPPAVLREDAPPPPRAAPTGPPRKTVVIVSDDPPAGESSD